MNKTNIINILGLDLLQMQKFVEEAGIEKFRAKQIMEWIYKKGILSFADMTNIPKQAREQLSGTVAIGGLALVKKLDSKMDATEKYLLRTVDGYLIETVMIHGSKGLTICLSSQVGCPLKCKFCATGGMGFKRNLDASEIIEQVLLFKKDPPRLRPSTGSGLRSGQATNEISNLVFMGMGEPLLNYYNVMNAVKLLNSKDGMNFGIRRITVSTCGLPNEIRKLAKEDLDLNLSVSLNAPNDHIRNDLMPINRKFPIKELMKAIDYYLVNTRRRVTFEYVLIKEVNDTIKCATELAALLEGKLCHVNLIPFNPVKGQNYAQSTLQRTKLFVDLLSKKGVNATIRRSKGPDINAACGQLAGKYVS